MRAVARRGRRYGRGGGRSAVEVGSEEADAGTLPPLQAQPSHDGMPDQTSHGDSKAAGECERVSVRPAPALPSSLSLSLLMTLRR